MILDTHQHFWQVDRDDYGWLVPELGLLYRDYLPEHLQPILDSEGVSQTIVVQAAPTVAETEFLLGLADAHESIAGVVGWLDLELADFPKQLDKLRAHPKFVGLRPMIQDFPDDDWVLRPAVHKNLQHLADLQFPIDLLTLPRHLPHVLIALQTVPNLRAVINHISKPGIKDQVMEPWAQHIQEISAYPNIYCKLSGMVTEADHKNWSSSDLVPFVQHIMACFGDSRVMFGSDWPVCTLAASYAQVLSALRACLGNELSAAAQNRIYWQNGQDFYALRKL